MKLKKSTPHTSNAQDQLRIKIEPRYITEVPAYEKATEVKAEGVEAIYYDGPNYKGRPSKVFAFYGCPEVKPGQKVPGIILVHGGGGTAFSEWVKRWVANGYAAIALDTVGTVPIDDTTRHVIPDGGPSCGPDFVHLDDPLEDQWPYYAENAIARARTLLGSFPQVDEDRIGITGISWGGYLSSIAAAIDHRYHFAVHVYGCGFLKEKSLWMEELNESGKERWSEMFDPSLYLAHTSIPVLWVTGTNDSAYPIESLIKSYSLLTKAPLSLCITIEMQHGHHEGWSPPEIKAFTDSLCLQGISLPTISEQRRTQDDQAWAKYNSSRPIIKAELIFAKQTDANWMERKWEKAPAKIQPNSSKVSATIPPETMYCFFNIHDDRGLMVSTPVSEIQKTNKRLSSYQGR